MSLKGPDHYLGAYGTKPSRDAYDRLTAEWLANERRLPIDAEAPITVTELAAEYRRFAKGYHRTVVDMPLPRPTGQSRVA